MILTGLNRISEVGLKLDSSVFSSGISLPTVSSCPANSSCNSRVCEGGHYPGSQFLLTSLVQLYETFINEKFQIIYKSEFDF